MRYAVPMRRFLPYLAALPVVTSGALGCGSSDEGTTQAPLTGSEGGSSAQGTGGTSTGTGGRATSTGAGGKSTSTGAGGTSTGAGGMVITTGPGGHSSAGHAGTTGVGQGGGTSTGGGGSPPASGPTVAGCPVFPADNEWNRDVSGDEVDVMSDAYMASMNGATKKLHPDFGSDPAYGIPYITVPGSTPKVPMTFDYADESDPGPYPFPPDAPIEGGASAGGDRHVIVIDQDTCTLYETFDSHFVGPGWMCGSGAVFDLHSNKMRPEGWTSADAAGLPIFPGLARRDEADAGEIKHALRFTVQKSQKAYVHPAVHQAGSTTDASYPPMGLRVRMKASFDTSTLTGQTKAIVTAMKKYGMIVADNGSDWFVSGASDAAWNDDDLTQLKQIPASAFEVVKVGAIMQ